MLTNMAKNLLRLGSVNTLGLDSGQSVVYRSALFEML